MKIVYEKAVHHRKKMFLDKFSEFMEVMINSDNMFPFSNISIRFNTLCTYSDIKSIRNTVGIVFMIDEIC